MFYRGKLFSYFTLAALSSQAGRVNLTVVNNAVSDYWVQLFENRSLTAVDAEDLSVKGVRGVLEALAPQIKAQLGYSGIFVANCSLYINTVLERVNCNISSPEAAMAVVAPLFTAQTRLPWDYAYEITRSHIVLVNVYADWTGRFKLFDEDYAIAAYPRTATCSLSSSDTLTPLKSETNEGSADQTITQTLADSSSAEWLNTDTFLVSPTKGFSRSQTVRLSASGSGSVRESVSSSVTDTLSLWPSPSLSLTVSVSTSFTESRSGTRMVSLTGSFSRSPSVSGSWSGAPSQTYSSSQTVSNLASSSVSQSGPSTQTATFESQASITQAMNDLLVASVSTSFTRSPSEIQTESTTRSFSRNPSMTGTWSQEPSQSQSQSLPVLHQASSSLSQIGSSTQTPTFVRCASTTQPMNGLLAAWPASSGVYADAVNQTNRYTVSNGVVTDTLTNMQWEQTAGTIPMVFSSVSGYCSGRSTGGFSDWRAPNIVELGTLIDYTSSTAPFLNTTAFPGASASTYWSGSPDIGNSGSSWYYVGSNHGQSFDQDISTSSLVRCVRSCYAAPPGSRYTIGTASVVGTVTDNVTGLIWQKAAPTTGGPNSNGTYNQSGAISYCNSLSLGGSGVGTWRLPKLRELQTLVDYSKGSGTLMMDTSVFLGEPAAAFWTSSPVVGTSGGWFIRFYYGHVLDGNTTTNLSVRCVRSENQTQPTTLISTTASATQSELRSVSLSQTLTLQNTASDSQTSARSDSYSNTWYSTGTYTNSNSAVESVSKTKTRLSGILAAWNQTGGTYADATTQASRYSSASGVVTDTLTGLQWELTTSASTMTWAQAVDYCTTETTGGFDDWRLPNNAELESLLDYTIPFTGSTPGINAIFTGTPTSYFWSSIPLVGAPSQVWYVSYGQTAYYSGLVCSKGFVGCDSVPANGYTRCVRSLYRPLPAERYTATTDTVTDTITGLIWQRVSTGGKMTQANATTYCNSLSLLSFSSGWSLPTVKELSTLVDYSVPYSNLMMDSTVFAGEPAGGYWSSTPVAGLSTNAWRVIFNNGDAIGTAVTNNNYVRCVR